MTDSDPDDPIYTPGCTARCHLESVLDGIPDPEVCGADDHVDDWCTLLRQHNHIGDALRVIEGRYRQDRDHGGALTKIAEQVRDAAREALTALWEQAYETYIAATLEKDRETWDCPFCGVSVPEAFDEDRCPACCCVLWTRADGNGWV